MALASADRCAEGAGEAGTGKEAVVPMFVIVGGSGAAGGGAAGGGGGLAAGGSASAAPGLPTSTTLVDDFFLPNGFSLESDVERLGGMVERKRD